MSDNRTAEIEQCTICNGTGEIQIDGISQGCCKVCAGTGQRIKSYIQQLQDKLRDSSQQTAGLREENERLKANNDSLEDRVDGLNNRYADAVTVAEKQHSAIKQLQEEVERVKGDVKRIAVDFFYWWHNQPGTNTEQGFDKYIETERFKALSSKESKTS